MPAGRRHLIYQLAAPAQLTEHWQWGLSQLAWPPRWQLFDGYRVLAVALGDHLVDLPVIEDFLRTLGIAFDLVLPLPNSRLLRDTIAVLPSFAAVRAACSAEDAIFFAHSKGVDKGVSGDARAFEATRLWANCMFRGCLDDWARIEDGLRDHAAIGLLKSEDFEPHFPAACTWHFPGNFFWAQAGRLYSRMWNKIAWSFFGAESWLGHFIPAAEGLGLIPIWLHPLHGRAIYEPTWWTEGPAWIQELLQRPDISPDAVLQYRREPSSRVADSADSPPDLIEPLNQLLRGMGATRYLQLGLGSPPATLFHGVSCDLKHGVDPHPGRFMTHQAEVGEFVGHLSRGAYDVILFQEAADPAQLVAALACVSPRGVVIAQRPPCWPEEAGMWQPLSGDYGVLRARPGSRKKAVLRYGGLTVRPIMISHFETRWIQVGVRSYREQFPEDCLLVVDGNARATEDEPPGLACPRGLREWLQQQAERGEIDLWVPDGWGLPDSTFGSHLDWLWPFLAQDGCDVMVVLHPDMLFTGRDWLGTLVRPLCEGQWMTGSYLGLGGDLHPTLSAWRLDISWPSFRRVYNIHTCDFYQSEEFRRLFDVQARAASLPEGYCRFDEGLEGWFQAAKAGKATLVEYNAELLPRGVRHWWGGSYDPATQQHAWLETPEARRYLLDGLG